MPRIDKKKRKDKYTINVYGTELHVLINYTDADIKAEYIQYSKEEITEDLTDVLDGKGMQWGMLRDKSSKARVTIININTSYIETIPDLVNTMAHEAYHAAMCITRFADIEYSSEGEEAYAYLIGYITECVYKTVFKV